MKHLKALTIKFIMAIAILFLMLVIFENATFFDILLISLLVTGVSYLIGDLFLLPRTGVFVAALADFGLNFAAIWILSSLLIEQAYPLGVVSGFAAFFIACAEGFFHRYMLDHVLGGSDDYPTDFFSQEQLQTEFSSEEELEDELNKRK